MIAPPFSITTYPVVDLRVSSSPAQLASEKTSGSVGGGRNVIPRSDDPERYRRTLFAAMRCREQGLELNAESCPTAHIMSGLVTQAANMKPPTMLAYSVQLTRVSISSFVFVSLIAGSRGVDTELQSSMPWRLRRD